MHMCSLGGHFDEEYTPGARRCRGVKASFSAIRLPSCRKTAWVSAASRSPRPRTRSDPCSATKARSASRCSAAQRAASPDASVRSTGGLPGRRSTLSSEVGGAYVISAPPFASSSGRRAGSRAAAAWDGRRTHSGALHPLESALDQLRLIGEDRLTDEVPKGHRAVKGNRQLQSGERRAAQVEKVIPPADLPLGNAEHLRPRSRQPVFGRRTRQLVTLVGDIEFFGECRQRLLVNLPVVRQPQTVPPMEGRRDHVLGQRRAEPFPQRIGIQWPLAGIEGHQALAAVGPLRDDDRVLADAWHAQEGVLDLADLDPEATDLDLIISAAEKLHLAFGQPAAMVTATVQPTTLAVRIGHEGSPRALGIVDVAAADTYTGKDDLPWRAERHHREVLVHDVDRHVVDRTT